MTARFPFLRRAALLLAVVPMILQPSHSFAADAAASKAEAVAQQIRTVKQIQVQLMRQGTKRKLATAQREARERAVAKRLGRRWQPGERARPAPVEIESPATRPADRTVPTGAKSVLVTPTNVKANNSTGDTPNATQSETSIASWGDYVFAAWNDGQGSATGGAYQGYSVSSDGGATFLDGGDPPKPPGFPAFRWTSDPVVTVNEKTGEFYYCGLANTDATRNAIAVARGHFTGATFVWDGVVVTRSVLNTVMFLDKQWIIADSSGAGTNVYLTNTTFTTTGDQIEFQRSTDGGATWLPATMISSAGDNGYVQGSRVATGPAGEVIATWSAIGQGTAEDWMRVRRSVNGGVTFAPEVTATGFISNFGTGSPGFNRERGIHFPSIAVDRTNGVNRGRLYMTWNESYNFQDDLFGGGVARVEVEGNDTPATGNSFNPGDVLRGTTGTVSPADLDYWAVSLSAGQKIVVWADSLPASQTYTLRMFAPNPDGSQRLAFGGDVNADASVGQAFFAYVAPVTATYYLRMAPAYTTASSKVGPYRISTAVGVSGSERGRDQRDVFVTWSDNGTSWVTPVRVNDDIVGLDDYLPEVSVGGDGCPYVSWADFRDDPYGSRGNQYLARSADGGASWAANQRVSSVTTNWTTTQSNLAPNLGDYSHLWADDRWVHPVWADGRDGSPDVYTTRVDVRHTLEACAPDTTVTPGTSVDLSWLVRNDNALFGNDYAWTLANARGWAMPTPGTLAITAGGTATLPISLSVPDSAAPGVNPVTLEVRNARNTLVRTCVVSLTVPQGQVSVGHGALAFALRPSVPNPARGTTRIGFTIPQAGRVTLQVFGLRGERVRTLVSGEQAAGAHSVAWDGRDNRGRLVGPGTYFYRLEGLGKSATQRLVWIQ